MAVTKTVLHNSDIREFKTCRQRWDWSSPLRENLEPSIPVHALEFGTIWHAALEAYYTFIPIDGERRVKPGHAIIDHLIDEWLRKIEDEIDAEAEEEIESYRALGHGMLDNYAAWAPTVDDFDVIFCERPFVVPTALGTPYGFKPDMVVRRKDGRLWIVEWKSARTLPGDDTDYLLTDDQVGRYLWGMRQAIDLGMVPEIQDEYPEGCIYVVAAKRAPAPLNVLKNGLLSKDKKQITTYALARDQITKKFGEIPTDYQDFLAHFQEQGYSKFFFREPVRRSKIEIENIGKSLLLEGRDMLNDPSIYRNPSAFNCNKCSFLGPCLAKWEGTDYKAVLAGNFRESEDA